MNNKAKPNQFGLFKVLRGTDADKSVIKPTEIIIETLLPKSVCAILAGTTGANKSFYAMQMGMSIANDEDDFLGFTIMKKGLSVLLVDTEIGENLILERYDALKRNFKWKGSDRFNMISKTGSFDKIWDSLDKSIKYFKPDIVIIDCLYNVSTEKDFSKSHKISKVMEQLTKIKNTFDITLFCVHHMNKGGHEVGLTKDRMSGASALQNWVEHLVLMTNTNNSSTRLLKVDKSRVLNYPEFYYGIDWNSESLFLENKGIVENWKHLMQSEETKLKWARHLKEMDILFDTDIWVSHIIKNNLSERTAYGWLREMQGSGVVRKVKHGRWEKILTLMEME